MRLEEELKKNEEAKAIVMARKIRLRKKLATLTGERLKATERELAAIAENEDQESNAGAADISFPPSPSASPTGLHMSPQAWAARDSLSTHFWRSPGPQVPADDVSVVGVFDTA